MSIDPFAGLHVGDGRLQLGAKLGPLLVRQLVVFGVGDRHGFRVYRRDVTSSTRPDSTPSPRLSRFAPTLSLLAMARARAES